MNIDPLVAAWRTNNRVTEQLIKRLPAALWDAAIPGAPRRTVRQIAAHIHNARCAWLRKLGREHGIAVPMFVDRRCVTKREVLTALKQSSRSMEALLQLGIEAGGTLPPTKAYVWRNLALDVPHVLTYFVGHEAHHRGQIVMVSRQLGHRLSNTILAELWRWK